MRRGALEPLEPRTLLAAMPAPAALGAPLDVSQSIGTSAGHEHTPQVAYNPVDPSNMASVWVRNDPNRPGDTDIRVEGAISQNGGASWTFFNATPSIATDPVTGQPFAQVTDPSVAFDRNGNLFVSQLQSATNGASGALVLHRFNGSGGYLGSTVAATWDTVNTKAIFRPVLAIDTSTTITDNGQSQTAPFAGNIYLAYVGNVIGASPTTIELIRSTDGGLTFPGAPLVVAGSGGTAADLHGSPQLAVSQGRADGTGPAAGQVTIVWDDFGALAGASPARSVLRVARVTDGGATIAGQTTIPAGLANAPILGGLLAGTVATASSPVDLGPAPAIASDNTLGAFSPFQGRLYVVYTGRDMRAGAASNPADNTDIFISTSDDGGVSWSSPRRINNDLAAADGFSQTVYSSDPSQFTLDGRPQYQPAAAVDVATGTLAVSWFDTRYDAAAARVATFVAVSNDGGANLNGQTFVNRALAPTDLVTGTAVNLGPIPDNQSDAADTGVNAGVGFGARNGLTIFGGQVYAAWASNENIPDNARDAVSGLNIRLARASYAAGPRVLSGTSGPVSRPGDGLNPPAADGAAQVQAFEVVFDRRVDPGSFTFDDLQIIGRDPVGTPIDTGITAGNTTITALDADAVGATRFRVSFPAQTTPGTYSYLVGPDVLDRIRVRNGTVTRDGNAMDQDSSGASGTANDRFAQPRSQSGVPLTLPYAVDSLPLIVPGPHVVDTLLVGYTQTGDNLALNGPVSSIDLVFDRPMRVSSFTAADVLRVTGPAGPVAGPYSVLAVNDPGDGTATRFRVGFPEQVLSGTYTVEVGPDIVSATGGFQVDSNLNAGLDALREISTVFQDVFAPSVNVPLAIGTAADAATPAVVTSTVTAASSFLIADADLTLDISFGDDPSLEAYLVLPDGVTEIRLFRNVGASGNRADFSGTVLDSQASTPIDDGAPPFSGRFRPQEPLDALNGRDATADGGVYTLKLVNRSTTVAGTLNSWSLTFKRAVFSPFNDGLGEPAADRIAASFRIFTTAADNPAASSAWVPVGPASIDNDGRSGRVPAIAVDPSDPSGNTVYIGGSSGGVWKTTNFLTLDPDGPTWIPLTDFGPAFGLNIGAITIFPVNDDPSQSIIFVATGQPDSPDTGLGGGTRGTGFLRSTDGGATWTLLDSTNNNLPFAQRDHAFAASGAGGYSLAVDPRRGPGGGVIVYAALTNGLWRSQDTGQTWQLLSGAPGTGLLTGAATDIVFDHNSGTINASNPTGNLQILYAAVQGRGVFQSTNQGDRWTLINGGVGKPNTRNGDVGGNPAIPVAANPTPNGAFGRIALAKPGLVPATETNATRRNFLMQGWLYAAVVQNGNVVLYQTKDSGANWVQIVLSAEALGGQLVPTNNTDLGALALDGSTTLSLVVDPADPNVVYLGVNQNPAVIRIDTQAVQDAHAFYVASSRADGGATVRGTTAGGVTLTGDIPGFAATDPRLSPYINLLRNPDGPLGENPPLPPPLGPPPQGPFDNATFYVNSISNFTNNGLGATWVQFESPLGFISPRNPFSPTPTMGVRQVLGLRDPITGRTRLIFGDDQGIYTGVDDGTGRVLLSVGTAQSPTGTRNGNLQLAQFYYGAIQPSARDRNGNLYAALLYGSTYQQGGLQSAGNILDTGDLNWNGPEVGFSAGAVATNPQGQGGMFQYWSPGAGGNLTDFFAYASNGQTGLQILVPGGGAVGRTIGLVNPNDPAGSWPAPNSAGTPITFALNPLTDQQIVISSPSGRVYRTQNQGLTWFDIGPVSNGLPQPINGSPIRVLTYGAPDPALHGGNLDEFIYAGTQNGQIWLTPDGGTTWRNVSAGLDGSPVMGIATSPIRGSHEAYAVTQNGVYHIPNSLAGAPGWTSITGNLFGLTHAVFGNASLADTILKSGALRSLAVDWRYSLPDNRANPDIYIQPPANPGAEAITSPLVYVGGQGGVFRTTSNGGSWLPFPADVPGSLPNAPSFPGPGGGLPTAHVTDLDLSLGKIDLTTGRPVAAAGDNNMLVAWTFGRGAFATRLAPVVLPELIALDPRNPDLAGVRDGGSDSGNDDGSTAILPGPAGFRDKLTNVLNPFLDGYSQQTGFGSTTYITLYAFLDPNDPTARTYVGGYNPADPVNTAALGQTDAAGRFIHYVDGQARLGVQILAGLPGFSVGRLPDGLVRIGVQATNQDGTAGNIALFEYTLDTTDPATPLPIDLDPSTDSGILNDDDLTNFNNDPSPANAPLFNVGDPGAAVEDGATVVLYRTPVDAGGNPTGPAVVVNRVVNVTPGAGGAFAIRDVNTEYVTQIVPVLVDGVATGEMRTVVTAVNTPRGVIPDGRYLYTARQIDRAGNLSPAGGSLIVTIDRTEPTGQIGIDLIDQDDTGRPRAPDPVRYDIDDLTFVARPTFEGTVGVAEAGALVELLVNGVSGGIVRSDTTTGNYLITSGIDLSEGANDIQVRLTDNAGNPGPASPILVVTLDTLRPGPVRPDLTAATDTGLSNSDNITGINIPEFDGRAEPGALVRVYAQLIDAQGNLVGPKYVAGEAVADAQGNFLVRVGQYREPLVDSVGRPGGPDPILPPDANGVRSLPDGSYQISAQQFDKAGNAGIELVFGNAGAVVIDGTDSNDHGSYDQATNTNQAGWFYMQQVLDNILPNITSPNRVLVSIGADPADAQSTSFSAAGSINYAFQLSTLPAAGWSLVFIEGEAAINDYFNGLPAQAFDANNTPIPGGIRSDQTGFLYISTAGNSFGDLTEEELTAVNQYGVPIADIVNTGAGFFAQAESPFTPTVVPWQWLTSLFPGLVPVDAGGGGVGPNDIQITPAGQAAFPNLTPADLSTGPWHNYFTGQFGVLVPAVTDVRVFGDESTRETIILTSSGGASARFIVTIDTTLPNEPDAPDLQDLSDSPLPGQPGYVPGISDQDNYTNVSDPIFDVGNVEPGVTLELLRDGVVVRALNGVVPTGPNNTVSIQDLGPVPAGVHLYAARQVDKAGNIGSTTGTLAVTFDYGSPAAPGTPDLQDASDTPFPGQPGFRPRPLPNNTLDDNITFITSPVFDVSGVEPGATLQLLRNGIVVRTLVDVAGGVVAIQDPAVADGTYLYAARQYDAAGNVSTIVGALTVVIDTTAPAVTPTPDLRAASDTGPSSSDNVTSDNRPVFDVTAAEATATVQLLRKLATQPASAYIVVAERIGPGAIQDAGSADPGGVVPDGVYDYASRQVDVAGNLSPRSAALQVTIDTTAPAQPDAPDLDAGSDTGISNTDDITRITLFAFPIFNISGVETTATVFLFRDGGLVNTRVGPGTVNDPVPVADGVRSYRIRQRDLAGNLGPFSAVLLVTIDTAAPVPPSAPDLQASSDSGPSDTDDITGVTNPQFDVLGVEPNVTLNLLRDGVVVATLDPDQVGAGGTVAIRDNGPVPVGSHVYTAFQVDKAGNQSPIGGALTIVINSSIPQAPSAPDLQPSSDTGISSTDNITNITRTAAPVFDAAPAELTARVELFRDGARVAFRTGPGPIADINDLDGDGISDGPIPDGTYTYTARQVNQAGNPSPFSPALVVTYDTAASTPSPPDLQAASDTGARDDDNLTNVTSPTFDVSGVEANATVQLIRGGVLYDGAGQSIPDNGVATSTLAIPPDGGALKVAGLRVRLDIAHGRDSDLTATLIAPDGTRIVLFDRVGGTGANFTGTVLDDAAATAITAGTAPFGGSFRPAQALAGLAGKTIQGNWTLELRDNAVGGGTGNRLNSWALDLTVMATRTGAGPVTDPGPLADGSYTYHVRQVDLAGNVSDLSAPLTITVSTAAVSAPGRPDLQASSDTGISNSDDITRAATPAFDIAGAAVGNRIDLYRKPAGTANSLYALVGSATRTDANAAAVTITDPAGLADGQYDYAARQVDPAGNQSAFGPVLTITVDNTAPAAPGTPDLDPQSDTGSSSSDDITSRTAPVFTIAPAEPGATVVLLRRPAGSTGAYAEVASRTGPGPLADSGLTSGQYQYAALVRDAAGNQSPLSGTLTVTVDTSAPPAPVNAPDLQAASDTGSSSTDNVTAAASLAFTITGTTAGNRVELLRKPLGADDTQYAVIASADAAATVTLVDATAAADGRYVYTTRQVAAAGGASPFGPTLEVAIDRATPAVPGLTLVAADDTGIAGDGKTSARRPRFTGTTEPGATVELLDPAGTVIGSATASTLGQFTIQPSSNLLNGAHTFRARARDTAGNQSGATAAAIALTLVTADGDYDGDGKADLAVFRPVDGRFLVGYSGGGALNRVVGQDGDIPLRVDFDGDGRLDAAVYRPGAATFISVQSSDGRTIVQPFGDVNDIPLEGDYDGDGKSDYGVFHPATATFLIAYSGGGARILRFGPDFSRPVAGDFDGDGKTDIAVFHPDSGYWFIIQSTAGARAQVHGGPGDTAVPGDYDGDGKADLAVYRPSTGQYLISPSSGGGTRIVPLWPGQIPLLGDFDGDGKADPGVYDLPPAVWAIAQSRLGARVQPFGWPGVDRAIPVPVELRRAAAPAPPPAPAAFTPAAFVEPSPAPAVPVSVPLAGTPAAPRTTAPAPAPAAPRAARKAPAQAATPAGPRAAVAAWFRTHRRPGLAGRRPAVPDGIRP